MVDIHCHALYDVDDGSKSLDQTVKMIKMAREAGYHSLCFTPHYMEDGYKTSRGILESKLQIIKEALILENINDVNLYLGEEVYIFPELAERLDEVVLLNDSKYILFELPLNERVDYVDEVIYKLQAHGKIPVLAHPERYLQSKEKFSFVENLAKKGVLMQINLNSLSGHYGNDAKKIALKMLKNDMVQFIATDAHSQAGYSMAKESINILRQHVSTEKAFELLEENPGFALANLEVKPWNYTISEKSKRAGNSFLSFMKTVPFLQKIK
ncbi:MAG: hypothetical protein IKR04_05815 [Clostridia bacterium]|nr:hypothetical protein [Clostridia bacterium]